MRTIAAHFYWLFVVYFIALPNAYARSFADKQLLYPTRNPVDAGSATHLVAEPEGLEIWVHHYPEIPRPGVRKIRILHFIGNASRAEAEVPVYLPILTRDFDVEIWSVNYPGFGGSRGNGELKEIAPAALRAFDEILMKTGEEPDVISGRSFGGVAALYLASTRPVHHVLVDNPPPIQYMMRHQTGWWQIFVGPLLAPTVPKELDALATAKRSSAPMLMLTAGKDTIVDPKFQRLIFQAYGGGKRQCVIPGIDHNDPVPGGSQSDVEEALKWLTDATITY